jgi:FMN-dependent NADH-azoreductase
MKLLHIDTSIQGENSVSRQVSAAIVDRLRETIPNLVVTYRDLASAPLPHLSVPPGSPQGAEADGQAAIEEFLAADTVVIGAPMYNFTIPSQLKAWIARILVAGKTFRYSEKGVEGLAGDKRVIIAISRGGLYGAGMPSEAAEHVETYLRTVFAFIGIANPEIIVAEGILVGPEQREKALAGALQAATSLRCVGSRQFPTLDCHCPA